MNQHQAILACFIALIAATWLSARLAVLCADTRYWFWACAFLPLMLIGTLTLLLLLADLLLAPP